LEFFRERDASLLVNFDYDRNLFKFEQNSALPVLKGRLKAKLDYWHTIGANSFVIDIIKCGYRIPFISTPCKVHFPNNKSALDNASHVESAISELVGNHAVVEVPFVPHVVNPLSVSIQSSGKKSLILDLRQLKRLILDLRHVNQFIVFGSTSLSAKIEGCYYHMLTGVITFLVLISSPVITILIFS